MKSKESLERSIGRYLDNEMDSSEEAKLAARLETDADAQHRFVGEALLHFDLCEVMREADMRSFFGQAEIHVSSPKSAPQAVIRSNKLASFWTSWAPLAAVLAAIVVLGLSTYLWDRPARTLADVAEAEPAPPPDLTKSIGTLVQQRDCVWSLEGSAWQCGEPLIPGTLLSLSEGAAEVRLENGVRLVITGPCQLQLTSEMQGRLLRGQVSAKVPRSAIGFSLTTPSSEVIDLGTEFGVAVDERGRSEVHVFEGEVISRWNDAVGKRVGRSLRLGQENAARYEPERSQAARITMDESRFLRDLAPRLPLEQLPPLPIKRELALWLSADRLVETDESGGVYQWGDLVCDPSQTYEVALQLEAEARPRLLHDAIHGLPAVRFDGVNDYLVTTPLETTNDQTIFVVLAITDDRATQGQIINYNGPPHRVLQFPTAPGVLQINARRFNGGRFRLAGLVHSGSDEGIWATEGHVHADFDVGEPIIGRPILLTYTYDTAADKASMYVNGELKGQRTAPWPAGLVSRKVIGRHGYDATRHFRGDIAELIIYNQAMSEPEIHQTADYLRERYGLKIVNGGGAGPTTRLQQDSLKNASFW